MILNYYELLGLRYDAATEQISEAYHKKVAECKYDFMRQRYDTAYYNLIDDYRRFKYDQSIGLYRYRKHGKIYRISVILTRVVLTITDAFMTFYWCFLFVVIVYVCAELYLKTGSINLSMLGILYPDEIYILVLIALMDLVGHFYIRRANRFLKHKQKMDFNKYMKYKSRHK